MVAAAAISVGSAGYVAVFVSLPQPVLIGGVVVSMGAIAAWGIKESVTFAGAMTLIEVGGLVLLIAAGALWQPDLVSRLPEMAPPLANPAALVGLIGAALLAVFAVASTGVRVRGAHSLLSGSPRPRAPCRGTASTRIRSSR